ncbi:EAL domain-containing protein [Aquisalimonas sp.]|uniref:putative bifunctional diguanylate cyclase/phosphodiesterase n=1 Tax=Aquisalimonas sp. TaxID=1872621 RepID=UPI0025BB8C5C|nr:EAL domain-containing protein [Aquisalimonas sp.]
MPAQPTRGPLLSLKWRAIALTSLVLIGLAALYALNSHNSLTQRFEDNRDAVYERQLRETELTLTQSADGLRSLAGLVSTASGLDQALREGDIPALKGTFGPTWATMQLDAGVDEVHIYSSAGEPLATWGDSLAGSRGPVPRGQPSIMWADSSPGVEAPALAIWVHQVLRTEQPITRLYCADDCRQYAVVPLLVGGATEVVVAMSRSLADAALRTRQVSGSEVALLVEDNGSAENAPERHLSRWGASVVGVTTEQQTLPVLRVAADKADSSQLFGERVRVEVQGRHYELAGVPLERRKEGAGAGGYFVLISDITKAMAAIRQDTRGALAVALSGWLAAEALLLAILWRPMSRLRRMAGMLPALAQGQFDPVRRSLAPRQGRWADEIDVLGSATLDLANRLETLQDQVRFREQRLAWLANHDSLTNLYNRRYFQQALDRALADSGRGAMLFLDLDRFKDVNELSGHHSGDQLLRLVADALDVELRNAGVVARLGGDEFAVLLVDADAAHAEATATRVVEVLDALTFSVGERLHRAVPSIGIALYPDHGETSAELMASADLAMYQAKGSSNQQRWYLLSGAADTRAELQHRVYWMERLREALATDGFELFVQPILTLSTNKVDHYEVLVRMRGEQGELVSPGVFIPVAEQSGQIVALDRWVISRSLQLLRDLHVCGLRLHLEVNISAASLRDAQLRDFLRDELRASGADPAWLILEITETAAVTDFAAARTVMEGLRELGCHFALDDFGVGFSTLHYLGQLPADYIKIDGSFIRNLTVSEEDRVIVRAIADIAAGFGKKTVAEFVDQAAIVPLLIDYGIDFAQGYYIDKPMPVDAIPGYRAGQGSDRADARTSG